MSNAKQLFNLTSSDINEQNAHSEQAHIMNDLEHLDEIKFFDLMDQLDQCLQEGQAIEDHEAFHNLSPKQQKELVQILNAQKLLAQLKPIQPPADLALNTARRARKRRREELIKNQEPSTLDLFLSIATLLLLITLISLVSHYVTENRSRQSVEQITP